MKINYKVDYALKSILDLAVHYDDGLVTIQAISKRINAPSKFLEQILLELKRGGFIESRRGKVGGYLLSRPPEKITLGEVIQFVDGPLEPIACIKERYPDCEDIPHCVFRPVWKQVFEAISGIVNPITFSELANKIKAYKNTPTYSI